MSTSISHAQNIYKCKGKEVFDSVVWQDSPCNAKEEVSRQKMRDYSIQDASRVGHGKLTSRQVSKLIRSKKLMVGMSKRDVIRSWGQPKRTDILLSSKGKTEQLVYLQYQNTPVVGLDEKGIVSIINYSKVIEKPSKSRRGLGTVNTQVYRAFDK